VDSGAVSGVLATGLRPLPGMAEVQQLLLKTISTPLQSKLQLFDAIVRHTDALGGPRLEALFTANPHGPICGPPHA